MNRLVWLNLALVLGCAGNPGGAIESHGGMSGAASIGSGGNSAGGTTSSSAGASTHASAGTQASAGTATGGGQSSDPAADVTNLIAVFCATTRSCCDPSLAGQSARDQCEALLAISRPFTYITQGSAALDRSKFAGCIAALRTAASACTTRPVEQACRGIIGGTKRVGDPCDAADLGYECGGDRHDVTCVQASGSSTAGSCQVVPRAKEGEPCLFEYSTAHGRPEFYVNTPAGESFVACFESDGLICSLGVESPPRCRVGAARGTACQLSSQCKYGDPCRGETDRTTCQAPLQLGDACFTSCGDLECFGGICSEPRFLCDVEWPFYMLPI